MKSATSSTSTGQHRTPWLIERTDTGPQLPRTSRPVTSTAEGNRMDTTPTSSTDPEFNAALEKVLEELAGVNAILADQ